MPWQSVSSGVSLAHLRREFEKSGKGELTAPCAEACGTASAGTFCGVCNKTLGIKCKRNEASTEPVNIVKNAGGKAAVSMPLDRDIWRLLFSFTKEGSAVFHGHLSLIEIFSMAMTRANLDVLYTQGFNPLVKLEIVSPLSIGIAAGAEIAVVDFPGEFPPDEFVAKMNATLPDGIRINQAECYLIPLGSRKHSLSSLLWGFGYDGPDGETVYVPAAGEKAYREESLGSRHTAFSLRRTCVLAKNITADGRNKTPKPSDEALGKPWASYFDVYRRLYDKEKLRLEPV